MKTFLSFLALVFLSASPSMAAHCPAGQDGPKMPDTSKLPSSVVVIDNKNDLLELIDENSDNGWIAVFIPNERERHDGKDDKNGDCPVCPDKPDEPDEPEEPAPVPPPPAEPPTASEQLVSALQENGQVGSFNALFGTGLPDSGKAAGTEDIQLLAELTGDPAFDQQAFTRVLPGTAQLYLSLQDDLNKRSQFNQLFGTDLKGAGAPSPAERGTLFDVAGDPAFEEDEFLTVLTKASELYTALQADAEARAAFNERFSENAGASGPPTSALRSELFDIAGDPDFNLNAFLSSLFAPPIAV